MREDLGLLSQLQKIDLRIQEIRRQEEEYPARIEALQAEIEAQRQSLAEKEEQLKRLMLLHREKERDLQIEEDHIRRAKDKLMEVKTNREYQAMLHEIEA